MERARQLDRLLRSRGTPFAWRPKDRAAIERLTMVQTSLDWDRIGRWAKRRTPAARVYGVEDRFREARGR